MRYSRAISYLYPTAYEYFPVMYNVIYCLGFAKILSDEIHDFAVSNYGDSNKP
jgi:hypothetical protein